MSLSPEERNLVLHISDRDRFIGSISAEIILVLYGDYCVSSSVKAYQTIQQVREKFETDICLVYRHFPTVSSSLAYRVMAAVEAAATQEKFWQMHDCLYGYQSSLDDGDLVCCASHIGLNVEQFLAEMASDLYVDRIGEDYVSGLQNNVTSAPTAFINGIRYQNEWDEAALIEAIASAI